MPHGVSAPDAPMHRIGLCVADDELRAWLADELALMTWIGSLRIEPTESLPTWDGLSLVIAEVDALSAEQLEVLRCSGTRTHVIAIATSPTPPGIAFAGVLNATLTSRQLRSAVRGCLMAPR
jgi:hypothetical protein